MKPEQTILLLGGSRQQVVAIQAAKACGYRTVLCDYLPDNPGQYHADVFYQESTTDRETILEIARKEAIGGIIAYSSDPAAPTAAYVAEQLGLPTNPLAAVEAMSVKTLFRKHMLDAGLHCPQAVGIDAGAKPDEIMRAVSDLKFPVVVKPTDSSGSKGVTIVGKPEEVPAAVAHAASFGRNGVLIAEEFIERAFPYVVGGDVFVLDGKVRFWGLMSCLRDDACPLVPVGEKTPAGLSETQYEKSKAVLQELVTSLGIRFGELNVEIIIGKNDIPYVIELGSRAGGNMIPVQLSDASGIDLVRANVMCAMGDDPGNLDWEPSGECYVHYVLHSNVDGTFEGVELSQAAEDACYRKVMYKEPGSPVEALDGANKALGILFFKFGSGSEMDGLLSEIGSHVKVAVSER